MTRALIVGYGSIGARHASLLTELGCDVSLVTRRKDAPFPAFASITDALHEAAPDYVVIANETAAHLASLQELSSTGFRGLVLVEKPLLAGPGTLPDHGFKQLAVAYNLRFHPTLQALRAALNGQRIVSVQAYVGQYLPDWRPGTDWRASYSTDAARGGGVLRDLSHEIDYLAWLFGPWTKLAALGGNLGTLDIAADESWAILMQTANVPLLTVQLNYLDRKGRREIVVVTDSETFKADLVAGTLTTGRETTSFEVERNASYRAQHEAMLAGTCDDLASAADGLETLATIAAIERAASSGLWINS